MPSGLGATHQPVPSIFTVSDLNGATGKLSRIRKAADTPAVIAAAAFDIELGRAYEMLLGSRPAANCPAALHGLRERDGAGGGSDQDGRARDPVVVESRGPDLPLVYVWPWP
jgi:hypothetical protein